MIDIPKDVSEAVLKDFRLPEKVDLRGYKPTYRGHPSQIRNLAEMIGQAKRPLILGGGILKSGAWGELMSLAENKCAGDRDLMGLGAFPENHPLYLGMLGMHGAPAANLAVQECDLPIGLGSVSTTG